MKPKHLSVRLRVFCAVPVIMALVVLFSIGSAMAATALIGGNICRGDKNPDGTPMLACDPVFNATVMVQDMHGNFVAYGNVTGNTWNAEVASPGEYLAVYSAPNFDATSREFIVKANYASVNLDSYLPMLPLPTANILVYTFVDNYVNSEDDFPDDAPMPGITLLVKDERGNVVARGVTGTQTQADMPAGAGPDINGLFYFRNLEPGDYTVHVDMSSLPASPSGNGWYLNSSIEGTAAWEVSLYPGDPGTIDGGYMAWFSFVDKLPADMPARADGGTITGRLFDADGPWFADEPFAPPATQADKVTPNHYVPNGLVILYSKHGIVMPDGSQVIKPIATAEAGTGTPEQTAMGELDPVTGKFTFTNVPPGTYTLYVIDGVNRPGEQYPPLAYIWQEKNVTVTPGGVTVADVFLPRWFARIHGTVTDAATNQPIAGAKVSLRIKDGSIWRETTTGPDGNYLFDELAEVEVLGYVDVEPPAGYRGVLESNKFNLSTRTVQWYACNYKADLQLEKIPQAESVINGFVYNDELQAGTWVPDGVYTANEERTLQNYTVELLDGFGNPVLDVNGQPVKAKTGKSNNAELVAQGWLPPYITYPPDEFGGVFKGYIPGFYEFRGLNPGNYSVRVVKPAGLYASPAGSDVQTVNVAGGSSATVNFGLNTLAPLSGEIEGGIFDDVNLDANTWSVLWDEKACVVGAPLGIYDHNGYFLGQATMGNPLCHPSSPYLADPNVCPNGLEKPEVERHAVHGPHIYVGNDPALPGYKDEYEMLPWTYNFGQGKYKLEADWSLLPLAMVELNLGMPAAAPAALLPQNPPVITLVEIVQQVAKAESNAMYALNLEGSVIDSGFMMLAKNDKDNERIREDKHKTSKKKKKKERHDEGGVDDSENAIGGGGIAQPQFIIRITGSNFGSAQGYATVTLAGKKLDIISWSDSVIEASVKHAVSGAVTVATSTGISNAMQAAVNTAYSTVIAAASVYVDGTAPLGGDGSKARPFRTIQDGVNNAPKGNHAYVFVAPGTYNENVKIRRSNVHVVGSGPNETIVNGRRPLKFTPNGFEQSGPVFVIGRGGLTGGVSNVMISGFTIKGGSVKGGVFGDYGNKNLDINNNIIVHNGGEYGGGIWLHNSNQNVDIWSNVIARNGNWGGYGGGISVNDEPGYETGAAGPVDSASHHTYDDNKPAPTTSYNIFNNLIYHNYSVDYGGGVSLYEVKDNLNVFGNLMFENRSDDHGGAMFFEDSGPANIYGNIFLRNFAADDGGAISFEDVGDFVATINVYNNLFAENIADDRGENTACGGAIALDDTFYVSIYNNTFTGNVVAGMNNPRGAAIDAERNGHEYLAKAPGFSDPKIYNNIIWNNWKLEYDAPAHRGGEAVYNYATGVNYRWTPESVHVDNPAVQPAWESYKNSESFTFVHNNIISGGYLNGVGNINMDPLFVNPAGLDWHLQIGSPAESGAPSITSARFDLELNRRVYTETAAGNMVEMGAYEYLASRMGGIRLPQGVFGAIVPPRP